MTGLPGLEDLTVFRIEVAEGVATVFMDRAPVNAQNGVFRDEVMRVFDVLHDSDEVRAIVLTGAGKTFSAGADLRDRPDVSKRGAYPRHSRAVRGGFDCVMECAKPVIAAVNGAALGADLRAAHIGQKCIQAFVVEAQAVDQCILFRNAEHARLGIAGLGAGRDGAHFHKAETHGGQRIDAARILVQACGHAHAVGDGQAGQGDRVVDHFVGPHRLQRGVLATGQGVHGEVVGGFGVHVEQEGAD